jgi:hypothetical protein
LGELEEAMASKTITVLTDDIDGKELKEGEGQTVSFSVGRTQYQMDLSDKNLEKFYDTLKQYTDKARKVGSARIGSQSTGAGARTDKSQLANIRQWAKSQGLTVSERGRISKEIRDAYDAAH